MAVVPPLTVAQRLHRRRIRVIGIGAPKSGTHSLAAVFEGRYRTAHEPEALRLVDLLVDVTEGTVDDRTLRRYLRSRERRLKLEVNSAGLNGLVVEHLVKVAPRSRFVLALRHPRPWLNSLIDHSLRGNPAPAYLKLRRLRLDTGRPHPPQERSLEERGLYTLDGYLASWAERTQRALDVVPPDRLLVIRTDRLSSSMDELAAFAGCPPDTLDGSRSHEYAAPASSGVVKAIDPAYLQDRIDTHCRPLLDRFFAEETAPVGGSHGRPT